MHCRPQTPALVHLLLLRVHPSRKQNLGVEALLDVEGVVADGGLQVLGGLRQLADGCQQCPDAACARDQLGTRCDAAIRALALLVVAELLQRIGLVQMGLGPVAIDCQPFVVGLGGLALRRCAAARRPGRSGAPPTAAGSWPPKCLRRNVIFQVEQRVGKPVPRLSVGGVAVGGLAEAAADASRSLWSVCCISRPTSLSILLSV